MIFYKINVFGRVQGVFFRVYTAQLAKKFGFFGYVKNLPNLSVEIIIKKNHKIKPFLNELKKGTKWSKVERIEVIEYENSKDNFTDFNIY